MICPQGHREGLSQFRHFSDKGEGVNFSRFCAVVFYGRPLTVEILFVLHTTFFLFFMGFYFAENVS